MAYLASNYSGYSTFWGWSVVFSGVYYIIKYRNQYNEVGIFSSYIVGLEIILRMTKAELFWEFGKYGLLTFLILGLLIEDIKRHRTSALILIYFFSLLPSILLVPFESFNIWRQYISFNLSGPLTLFFSFLYFRNRILNEEEILNMFCSILFPLISMSVILIIRVPSIDSVVFGSEANFQMSGGYGPNQVSSALGLAIAIISLSKILGYTIFINNRYDYLILSICSIQAYLTFARGGVLTAILAIFTSWVISIGYNNSGYSRKGKIAYVLIILIVLWNVATDFTAGMVEKRYLSIFEINERGDLVSGTGRLLIMALDLEIFSDNILAGVGPGISAAMRESYGYGRIVAAHSEFTRVLAEHGILGLIGLLSLFILSIREFFRHNKNEKCILSCFTTIAILTMLHSAMRLAMPGFIFGLGFIRLSSFDKNLE